MTQKLRGAIIGFGFISSNGHAPAYLRRACEQGDLEINAVVDPHPLRREKARLAFPKARIYPTLMELFSKEQGRLEFVDICTPPSLHAEIAHAALERGLHVLCEKPLTVTLEEAHSLLDHAQSVKRVVYPCHNYKHAPVAKTIRQILDTGKIGKVRSVTLNTFRSSHARGVPEWNPDWRRQRKWSGGGIAMDHGSHSLYLAFEWLGTYPTAVTAKTFLLEPHLYDTEDNFSAVLTFPNGLAHAHLTWTSGVRKVIYTIQGERGAITVDDDDLQLAVSSGLREPKWTVERQTIPSDWMDASHVNWFNSLFDQFRMAILQNDFTGKETLDAYHCVEVITHAYRSALQSSQEIRIQSPLSHGTEPGLEPASAIQASSPLLGTSIA